MLNQRIFILTLLFLLLLSACTKKVLSEKQMENVLFDIHIADAMISDNYRDFSSEEKKRELYASVFKKHGVTQEQFDTSLAWYGRNLDKYLAIYSNLDKRYAALMDSINARMGYQKKPTILPDSSHINIWEGAKTFILTSLPGENVIAFNMDTVRLSPKEYYEFAFNVLGVSDSITVPSVIFGIGFPDTVFVKRKEITGNGLFTVSLPPADSITNHPTHLFGSIYLPYQKGNIQIIIYNIGIYRKKKAEITAKNQKEQKDQKDQLESLKKINLLHK